jgi:hypothetical protein
MNHFYEVLKNETNPYEISNEMKVIIKYLESNENLKKYLEPLLEETSLKIIKEISNNFSLIKISEIEKLIFFKNKFELERMLTQNGKKLGILFDHKNETIEFGRPSIEIEEVSKSLGKYYIIIFKIKKIIVDFCKRLDYALNLIKKKTGEKLNEEIKINLTDYVNEETENMKKRKLFIDMKKKWEDEQLKIKEKKKEDKNKILTEQKKKLEEEKNVKELEKRQELEKKKNEEKKKEEDARKMLDELNSKSKGKENKKKDGKDKNKTAVELLKER